MFLARTSSSLNSSSLVIPLDWLPNRHCRDWCGCFPCSTSSTHVGKGTSAGGVTNVLSMCSIFLRISDSHVHQDAFWTLKLTLQLQILSCQQWLATSTHQHQSTTGSLRIVFKSVNNGLRNSVPNLLQLLCCATLVGRDELSQCVVKFQRDQWAQLIREASSLPSLVPPRTPEEEAIRRGLTAQSRVQRRQVSSDALRNRRPQERISDIPQEVLDFQLQCPLQLDPKLFAKCLREAHVDLLQVLEGAPTRC